MISNDAIDKLGRLVSTIGTPSSARKIGRNHEFREFSEQEEFWMETVIRELLRRAGKSDEHLRLNLSNLPPLA
jgi:hypothetical protein